MRTSISVSFDLNLAESIFKLCATLDSPEIQFVRSHITLLSAEVESTSAIADVVDRLMLGYRCFPIILSGIGWYSDTYLYLDVEQNATLRELQQRVFHAVKKIAEPDRSYYHPEIWHPHVTLVVVRGESVQSNVKSFTSAEKFSGFVCSASIKLLPVDKEIMKWELN